MSRVLLPIILLSGFVFLVSLTQTVGRTYYQMLPYPNERTEFPNQAQTFLWLVHANPWVGVGAAAQCVFAASSLAAAVVFIRRNAAAKSGRDTA